MRQRDLPELPGILHQVNHQRHRRLARGAKFEVILARILDDLAVPRSDNPHRIIIRKEVGEGGGALLEQVVAGRELEA